MPCETNRTWPPPTRNADSPSQNTESTHGFRSMRQSEGFEDRLVDVSALRTPTRLPTRHASSCELINMTAMDLGDRQRPMPLNLQNRWERDRHSVFREMMDLPQFALAIVSVVPQNGWTFHRMGRFVSSNPLKVHWEPCLGDPLFHWNAGVLSSQKSSSRCHKGRRFWMEQTTDVLRVGTAHEGGPAR